MPSGTTVSPLPVYVGYSTKHDRIAVHSHKMSTLRR